MSAIKSIQNMYAVIHSAKHTAYKQLYEKRNLNVLTFSYKYCLFFLMLFVDNTVLIYENQYNLKLSQIVIVYMECISDILL